jgi:hypothetical protein
MIPKQRTEPDTSRLNVYANQEIAISDVMGCITFPIKHEALLVHRKNSVYFRLRNFLV